MLSRELREFAHCPDRYSLLGYDVERFADERVCILQGNIWAAVSGVRVAADGVDDLVDEVRARVPGGKSLAWWLDPDTQPADLHSLLRARGLRDPADRASLLHALACVSEPDAGPAEIEVAPVATFDDHLAAVEIAWDAFSIPDERREQQRLHLREDFEATQRTDTRTTFLARLEGRPAGLGRSIYASRGAFLTAGCVAEWARGRGVYRALVRARWDDAVARNTPALVTEALPDTSYPILKRLGFEDVCTIRRLEDFR